MNEFGTVLVFGVYEEFHAAGIDEPSVPPVYAAIMASAVLFIPIPILFAKTRVARKEPVPTTTTPVIESPPAAYKVTLYLPGIDEYSTSFTDVVIEFPTAVGSIDCSLIE
jgi:hypothetical protein